MWKKWWGRRAMTPGPGEESGGRLRTSADPSAAESAGPPGNTPEDEALLDRIASAVVKWGMSVPAIFMLESSKPLNFVGGQFLHFLSPIVHSVVDATELDRLAVLLEKRNTMEDLILRIERIDAGDPEPKRPEKTSETTDAAGPNRK